MKKLLAGCLIALVLIAVASGAATYYLWRAATPMVEGVGQIAEGVKRLGDVSDVERGLRYTAPFDPPASGEFTPAQLERFIAVQIQVRTALGARADAFAAKYRELTRTQPDGTVALPSLSQIVAGLADMSNVYMDARRAQVAAMNEARFSREEFSWVRRRVYQAAGLDAARYNSKELERLLASMAAGAQVSAPDVTLPDAPARNRALVKPYATRIAEWLPMAFFGL